jgi:transketolase
MSIHLRDDWKEGGERVATRDGFGHGVVEAGEADPRVVVLCADLAESTRVEWFKEKFPERYIEMGVAEQNLAAVASGLANYGKIPFINSYAAFSPGRNFEQIRTTIAIAELPVIICGMHAGISVGPDGATHQPLEDIGLMRMMPHLTVIVPADAEEARKATIAAATLGSPVYIRFSREKSPVFTTTETPFAIGKANVLHRSDEPQVALIACGPLVHNALLAAEKLEAEGIGSIVVNNHTIKPLDESVILAVAREVKAVVTIEEHQVAGGLGGLVAELLARELPTPIEFIGVHDQFGQSGKPEELIEHYKLGVSHIIAAAKKVITRK